MIWLFISNLILYVIGYEILQRRNSKIAKQIKPVDIQWYFTKSTQLYLGWLLAGNYYQDFKEHKKIKLVFEFLRLYLAASIVYLLYSLFEKI